MSDVLIRDIAPTDNVALALVVRNALAEFGANKPGTVFFDPTTDRLYELFQEPGAVYSVAIDPTAGDTLLGGAGLFPSPGLPEGTCELVKMYLRPEARGKGLGSTLIRRCLEQARAMGYRSIYLESMPELRQALAVYERFGFRYLDGPMGDTGHFGCDRWMLLELTTE
jgi:putative acetyltransferase